MSHPRARQLQVRWWHAVLIAALPSACATSIQQEFEDDGDDPSGAGSGSGGALVTGGSGNVVPPMPKAGSGGSGSNPFGGSSSTGGKSTGGAAGVSGGGADNGGGTTSGGTTSGGTGGAGGASGGTGGGSGTCGCAKTLTWVDNTNISFATGDCMKVGDATYEYVGVKPQTWANKDCNPTQQLAWCSDVGADYKFTLCE